MDGFPVVGKWWVSLMSNLMFIFMCGLLFGHFPDFSAQQGGFRPKTRLVSRFFGHLELNIWNLKCPSQHVFATFEVLKSCWFSELQFGVFTKGGTEFRFFRKNDFSKCWCCLFVWFVWARFRTPPEISCPTIWRSSQNSPWDQVFPAVDFIRCSIPPFVHPPICESSMDIV